MMTGGRGHVKSFDARQITLSHGPWAAIRTMTTIAIIGGGFSGTMTAVNLARLAESPLRVCLVNRGFPLARGVAYSTGATNIC